MLPLLSKYRLHHLLFWVMLFIVWYYFRFQDFRTQEQAVWITMLKVADLALLVYITNYVLLPRLVYKKRYIVFALVFVLMICTTSTIKLYLISSIMDIHGFNLFDQQLKVRIYDNVIPHFLLVSTGAAFKLVLDNAKAQKRLSQMAKEKAEAELNFLKSQVNPHFLFNSLNAVYFLIDKNNADARAALHKFSDMLRYQLYELKDDKIPMEKEISYLEDYIAMQKLRKENCEVITEADASAAGYYIEPLLLLPFVENAFKHLSHFEEGKVNKIITRLEVKDDQLIFSVLNTTDGSAIKEKNEAGGIGLVNVKRRLEILYPGRHELSVSKEQEWFSINLKLHLLKP